MRDRSLTFISVGAEHTVPACGAQGQEGHLGWVAFQQFASESCLHQQRLLTAEHLHEHPHHFDVGSFLESGDGDFCSGLLKD